MKFTSSTSQTSSMDINDEDNSPVQIKSESNLENQKNNKNPDNVSSTNTSSVTKIYSNSHIYPKKTNFIDFECSDRTVRVFTLRRPKPTDYAIFNVTSKSTEKWLQSLSPFYALHNGIIFENFYQYSKVYPEHFDKRTNTILDSHQKWQLSGFQLQKAKRFPFGRPKIPLFSTIKTPSNDVSNTTSDISTDTHTRRLGYIAARLVLYCPHFASIIEKSPAFAKLRKLYDNGHKIGLADVDGYDHVAQNTTLEDVVDSPKPIMGHAFVICGLLEGNRFWEPLRLLVYTSPILHADLTIENHNIQDAIEQILSLSVIHPQIQIVDAIQRDEIINDTRIKSKFKRVLVFL